MQKIIELIEAVPRLQNVAFETPINWTINKGEHWGVIGANGSGKSLLIDILAGKYSLKSGQINCFDAKGNDSPVSESVKVVAFTDIYSLANLKNSYYQQRWNIGDEQNVPLVKDIFSIEDSDWLNLLIDSFSIHDLLDKAINLLSSGELRKCLIVSSLLNRPRILILDNPFIGLDISSRKVLNDLFKKLTKLEDIHIVLVVSNISDISDVVTHVLTVKERSLGAISSRIEFLTDVDLQASLFSSTEIKTDSFSNNKGDVFDDFECAIIFKNIHIKYGSRTILKNLDWQVRRGEKWALLGENGAGKSTLLSLVAADNPQAYANDITLFDRKRGTGESIWDIKKRIGYISPEMHLYYQKNTSCINIVGSGFFDTIGLYRKCTSEQEVEALRWMNILGVGHLRDKSFLNISSGEQRLVLLARTFVKEPQLLILDEPLHGLDSANKMRVKKIIEDYCDAQKVLIYVTHYENEIPSVVDKRLILRKNN